MQIICFIYALFNDAVHPSHYVVSACMVISEYWTGTDVAENAWGLISDTMPPLSGGKSSVRMDSLQAKTRTQDLYNMRQKCYTPDHDIQSKHFK